MINIFYNWISPAFKAGGPTQSLNNLVFNLEDQIHFQIICDYKDHDKTVLDVHTNTWLKFGKKSKVRYCKKVSLFSWICMLYFLKGTTSYINGFYSLRFSILPLIFLKQKIIISFRGMLDPGSFQKKNFKKTIYLFIWKKTLFHKVHAFHAASEIEKNNLEFHFGNSKPIFVIPNFPKSVSFNPIISKKIDCLNLVTIALINPIKNHLQVLKALRNITSNVTYNIYGPIVDNNYWKLCEDLIAQLPNNIQVIYHGVLKPDLVVEVLCNAHVYIQISDSENFGHTLIESLSIGRPIITSTNTPWNNLNIDKAGFNIKPEQIEKIKSSIMFFAAMDLYCLNDWSISSRKYFEKVMNIEDTGNKYLNMFN